MKSMKDKAKSFILYFVGIGAIFSVLIHFILICIDLADFPISNTFSYSEIFLGWIPLAFLLGFWLFRILFDRKHTGKQIFFWLLTLVIVVYSALFIPKATGGDKGIILWIIECVGSIAVFLCWSLCKLPLPQKIRYVATAITGISYSLIYSLCVNSLNSVIVFWPMAILYFIVFTILIVNDLYCCWLIPPY